MYADDAGNMFEARAKLQAGLVEIHSHFARFGLTMHVGRDLANGGADSKTEAMYVPPAGGAYEDVDTSPLAVDGGLVPFCKLFKYLGAHLHYTMSCVQDVRLRITKASNAFGALRDTVFCAKNISMRVKAKVYKTLVLSILLYGSECWALRAKEQLDLERFHRRCIRTMCNVTRACQKRHRITSLKLESQLQLESMRHLLSVRALRWFGHVVRMDRGRLPRKMLFGWVNHARRSGGQSLTFGRRIKREVLSMLKRDIVPAEFRRVLTGTGVQGGVVRGPKPDLMQDVVELAGGERARWRKFIHSGARFRPQAAGGT